MSAATSADLIDSFLRNTNAHHWEGSMGNKVRLVVICAYIGELPHARRVLGELSAQHQGTFIEDSQYLQRLRLHARFDFVRNPDSQM